jgi:hypothetical protein
LESEGNNTRNWEALAVHRGNCRQGNGIQCFADLRPNGLFFEENTFLPGAHCAPLRKVADFQEMLHLGIILNADALELSISGIDGRTKKRYYGKLERFPLI